MFTRCVDILGTLTKYPLRLASEYGNEGFIDGCYSYDDRAEIRANRNSSSDIVPPSVEGLNQSDGSC